METFDESRLPPTRDDDAEKAERKFWPKLLRVAGRIPFAEEIAAAWFAARDPDTPAKAKAALFAAVAYFVTPTDLVPDFIAGMGFTDDATVAMATLGLFGAYVRREHREAARERLGLPKRPAREAEAEAPTSAAATPVPEEG